MTRRWSAALALLALTSISFLIFPGHTILQADTQIYIPILERLNDPSLFANDEMAKRPHVQFTFFDEVGLLLRRITRLSFEQVLMGQQFVYRAVAILGVYLLALATGLRPILAWLAAALVSLGAAVIGPAVLIVEYEPVPRGFALPFVVFSLAMVSYRRWLLSAAAATIAFGFHPPTALAYGVALLVLLLWNKEFKASGVLASGPLVMVIAILVQDPSPDKLPLFQRIDPMLEDLQRMRAAYNWVSLWLGRWIYLYVILTILGFLAWLRIRRYFSRELNILVLALSIIGLLSVPLSYLLLERMKLMVVPQFQPGRYLLYVTFFTILLTSIAAIHAGARGSYVEAVLFFLVPLGMAATEWDPAKLLGTRSAVVLILALGCAWSVRQQQPWLIAIAGLLSFFALSWIGVQNYAEVHSDDLDRLAGWALANTSKDAVFQFADSEKKLDPGIFRARAKRALYVDWKSGGQVNFLRDFSVLWRDRWDLLGRQQDIDVYRKLGIDYVVFQASNKQPAQTPVYENARWVVYDLRKSSTSLRDGTEAWAPARVTEMAAAALANRSACSTAKPSVSATASPALNVSPAAVVSATSTANPGAWMPMLTSA
ncbi:MAG TPA: hypothetical protein VEX68_17305 [Bryobacteraceae bacterium]|nr:hypothetical protein [Bryobacteraceae bacterium]